jgi:hypothetical protein
VFVHHVAKRRTVRKRRQRDIDHPLRPAFDTAVRIEWVLERRCHHDSRIGAKNVLGTIPVMDIEIHNGDALEAVVFERMRDPDGDVVEEAKAHCARVFGMMPRRAEPSRMHWPPDRSARDPLPYRRTRRVQSRSIGVRVHRGIGIEVHGAGARAKRLRPHPRRPDHGRESRCSRSAGGASYLLRKPSRPEAIS